MRWLALALTLFSATAYGAASPARDWKDVDAALGRSGAMLPGNVYKVSFPRSDLKVTMGNVAVKPALALGSWAAFIPAGSHTMMMGDLVLTESEVNDVISALQAGGIEQTAVHNHLLGESPHVMYLHYSGHGDAVALARALHAALAKTGTPPPSAATPAEPDLPLAALDKIIGAKGKSAGGTYQFGVPRVGEVTDGGMVIPPSAGVATAINFQPTGNGRAAVTGDFVLIASEVNPVIRELRKGNIEVTALHSHMLTESPRLFFMHFWAEDDALSLARTLRAALDRMHVKK